MKILGFLEQRRPFTSWLLMLAMTGYIAICIVLFVQWVDPSLADRAPRVAADSMTYLYMADVVREGRPDPFVWASLASFPNTLWLPVLFALVLQKTFLMALANFLLFGLSILLFRRSANINVSLFLFFLLLNPTTTVSLLAVNKEIADMLVVALFCFFLSTSRKWALLSSLLIALLNRYEVCIALLGFLLMRSRLNPWRERRVLTVVLLVLFLTILLPLAVSESLRSRFIEASNAVTSTGLVAFLDRLEMHYMFIVAVVPKILENLFGELINVNGWGRYTMDDPANSYIPFFNNLATLCVLLFLLWKRSLKISSGWIYLALTIAVFMSIALVIQPRYFYSCFVLLCFQASMASLTRDRRPELESAGGALLAT